MGKNSASNGIFGKLLEHVNGSDLILADTNIINCLSEFGNYFSNLTDLKQLSPSILEDEIELARKQKDFLLNSNIRVVEQTVSEVHRYVHKLSETRKRLEKDGSKENSDCYALGYRTKRDCDLLGEVLSIRSQQLDRVKSIVYQFTEGEIFAGLTEVVDAVIDGTRAKDKPGKSSEKNHGDEERFPDADEYLVVASLYHFFVFDEPSAIVSADEDIHRILTYTFDLLTHMDTAEAQNFVHDSTLSPIRQWYYVQTLQRWEKRFENLGPYVSKRRPLISPLEENDWGDILPRIQQGLVKVYAGLV